MILAMFACCGAVGAEGMPEGRKTELVDGVSLAYEEYGSGRPIVFVHGFGASSYSWRQVAISLSKSNKVMCVDLMGFGYSDKPVGESYTLDREQCIE